MSDHVCWPSLVDRRFSARHLPPRSDRRCNMRTIRDTRSLDDLRKRNGDPQGEESLSMDWS